MAEAHRWVYAFGGGKADGHAGMKELLGGKGAGLAEMSAIGLPVPPGFTITTEVCTHYYAHNHAYPDDLRNQVGAALAAVEASVGARLGDPANPLLISVRSGARASMPGMMDTILNLGLNPETVEGLVKLTGDARFAWDSYRRFIQMYASVVMGIEHHLFEDVLFDMRRARNARYDTELTADDLKQVAEAYRRVVMEAGRGAFPDQVQDQLWGAVGAVFGSWMNQRAVTYRRLHDIPESWGTAVNVQAMVFGNRGTDCCTGVAFTRNPSTGANEFYGEYLINAQGEDVVAGIRTPQPLTRAAKGNDPGAFPSMDEVMPAVFAQLNGARLTLERHFRDMQDIEFTVQQGRLYLLQTRTGKRTAAAAIQVAVDMVDEGLIAKDEAIMRVDPASLDQLLHPSLDPDAKRHVIARGLPASPGAASGEAVFTADEAEALAQKGRKVILCRAETSPEDIHGMHSAVGIVTSRGGMTSHAAVVARGMGRPCVAGAGALHIDASAACMSVGATVVRAGDIVTIDGGTGEVMLGRVPTVLPKPTGAFATLMGWVDARRTMGVRANAETPMDARTARGFSAEGIGLCRTEHMFFDATRIVAMRAMIVAEDEAGRRAALAKLEPMQRQDFVDLFTIMEGLPVTVRFLDPPLHEFLPTTPDEIKAVANAAGLDVARVERRARQLHESNPMLGHRGCRLGITYPEIYEMQARALFGAAADVVRQGKAVKPEIMIPLIATAAELKRLKIMVDRVGAEVMQVEGVRFAYTVGTMIELPRAALAAASIAEHAAFFSFGTNDLTQTTFGLSRDDAGNFLPDYIRAGVLERDPFVTLDTEGVGELIRIAVERGRGARYELKVGICGEHGGDPASIRFCQSAGLNYVSCSPYRVPIARLAAAQAAIATDGRDEAARREAR